MPIVHSLVDEEVSDRDRRNLLFAGDLFTYSPRPATRTFVATCSVLLEENLGGAPAWALQRMPETEFRSRFSAAARTLSTIVLRLASGIVTDLGCDAPTTFVGSPSLVATSGLGALAHGLGVVQHPHRDTWYAASLSELNWWIPLSKLDSAALAFHPTYWDRPVENSSATLEFDDWYTRHQMGHETFVDDPLDEPRPLHPIDLTPDIRISCPAGGIILSSVAQLYSVVPGESDRCHFSVHFRSISSCDLQAGEGARNVDAEAHGTALSTFIRCSDFTPPPPELATLDLEQRRGAGPGKPREPGP